MRLLMQKLSRLFSGKLRLVESTINVDVKASKSTFPLPPGYNAPAPFAQYIKMNNKIQSGQNVADSMKRAAIEWKNLGDQEKNVYKENCNQIRAQKEAEFMSLPESQKQDLLAKNVERIEKQKRKAKKRALHAFNKETKKPKKPFSSYMLYSDELRKQAETMPKGKEGISSFGVMAGEKWKALSPQEKKVYEEKAAKLKEKYNIELENWKAMNAEAIAKWETEHQAKPKMKVRKAKPKKKVKAKTTRRTASKIQH